MLKIISFVYYLTCPMPRKACILVINFGAVLYPSDVYCSLVWIDEILQQTDTSYNTIHISILCCRYASCNERVAAASNRNPHPAGKLAVISSVSSSQPSALTQ
jgi:hypothetical protein